MDISIKNISDETVIAFCNTKWSGSFADDKDEEGNIIKPAIEKQREHLANQVVDFVFQGHRDVYESTELQKKREAIQSDIEALKPTLEVDGIVVNPKESLLSKLTFGLLG